MSNLRMNNGSSVLSGGGHDDISIASQCGAGPAQVQTAPRKITKNRAFFSFWISLERQTENPLITHRRAENRLEKARVIDCICSAVSFRHALQIVLQEALVRTSSCKQGSVFHPPLLRFRAFIHLCKKLAHILQQGLLTRNDRRGGNIGDEQGKSCDLHALWLGVRRKENTGRSCC